MDAVAIKATWDSLDAAQAEAVRLLGLAADAAVKWKKAPRVHKASLYASAVEARMLALAAEDAWAEARKAVAGLPGLDELAAWKAEQAKIAEENARQGTLI